MKNAFVAKSDKLGEGKHVRLTLVDSGGKTMKCMGFSYPADAWVPGMGERADVVLQLAVNEWNGTRTLEARLLDCRPVESAAPVA